MFATEEPRALRAASAAAFRWAALCLTPDQLGLLQKVLYGLGMQRLEFGVKPTLPVVRGIVAKLSGGPC